MIYSYGMHGFESHDGSVDEFPKEKKKKLQLGTSTKNIYTHHRYNQILPIQIDVTKWSMNLEVEADRHVVAPTDT